MPTTYAHYTFGEIVLEQLEGEVKELVESHINLFHIGLHGPDILFYHNPLKSNKINKLGSRIHQDTADSFFLRGRKVIQQCPAPEAASAYLLGFLCHYMLDSCCHPYINRRTSESELSHSEIEAELDRMLMVEHGLNPLKFKPTGHIIFNRYNARQISWFFKGINKNQMSGTLKSMRFCLNLLVPSNDMKRKFLELVFKLSGNYKGMKGLVINKTANPECKEDCLILKKIYLDSVLPTAHLLGEFYKDLDTTKPLNVRFQRNFE